MTRQPASPGTDHGSRLRTTAALLATAVYAWLALSSGLDRLADHGDAARIALWPFGAGHARAAARRALVANEPAPARAAAREAVRRDPFDAEGIGLLGEAARRSHDSAIASRAFAVGARLGWREPLTQAYWLDASLASGDVHAAADHLDAILRQAPELPVRNLLLAPFDATLAGRRELAVRLARRPAWAQAYFADTAAQEAGDPLARAEVAAMLAANHRVHDCALVAPLVDGLLRHGHYDQARLTRHDGCDATASPLAPPPVDGTFAVADPAHPATALDWHFTDDGAISVAFARRAGSMERALVIDNASSAAVAVAEQPLRLRPGPVRLSWRAQDAAGRPSAALRVALTCDVGGAPWLSTKARAPGSSEFTAFTTIPIGCTSQRLVVGVAGNASGVEVGNLSLSGGLK